LAARQERVGRAGAAAESSGGDSAKGEDLAGALARRRRPNGLGRRDNAMLDYAIKLTRRPGDMGLADVELLRSAGFEDQAILDICQVVAYYAYVNRLADGLGVELEEYWDKAELVLPREEFEGQRNARLSARPDPPQDSGAP